MMISIAFLFICAFDCLLLSSAVSDKAKRFGGAEDVVPTVVKSQPFSPQVVFQCGYKNRYMSRDGSGQWTTDKDQHASCLTGKLDILKYCRKVYPDLQITNIVESSHYYEVSDWCKLGGNACKGSFWVKPYRCVVGAFESEALLVPESCHFGHVDERNVCNDFDYWNKTAHSECGKRPTTSVVRSFAMLDPCGLDVFSGVEFVCCPDQMPAAKPESADKYDPSIRMDVKVAFGDKHQQVFDDDEDESSDEEDDYDEDEDDYAETKTSTRARTLSPAINRPKAKKLQTTTTAKATTVSTTTMDEESDEYDEDDEDDSESVEDAEDDQDPYFRVADPDREHDEYTAALERLEKRHRQKVAKVMKEWAELESRFQDMKEKDPNRADKFRGEMTSRFQRTVAALEEENRDERRQIEEVHQQRVNAFLNERVRETIQAFRDALSAPSPQAPKVLRTLQAYIRAEEKDRVHALNRYRRFLRKDPDAAAVMKAGLVRKMSNIDTRINATIEMLHDAPQIEAKVKPAILDFWKTFRQEHTPDFIDSAPPAFAAETNRRGDDKHGLVDAYKKQYQDELKRQGDNEAMALDKSHLLGTEDEKQRVVIPFDGIPPSERDDEEQMVVKPVIVDAGDFDSMLAAENKDARRGYLAQEDVKQAHAFSLKETIHHDSVIKEEEMSHPQQGTVGYVVFGVATVALMVAMVVAIAAVKRYYSVRGQGFVKVDPCNPEERHVAAMQTNGYENPTYKYFDDKP